MEVRKSRKSISKENTDVAMYYLDLQKKFKERLAIQKSPQMQKDTEIRIELHNKISAYVKEGKSKEDILKKLSGEERYSKYEKYIPIWIDDKIKNKDIQRKSSFNRDSVII